MPTRTTWQTSTASFRPAIAVEIWPYLHPDMVAAGRGCVADSGWQHFPLHGRREGSSWVERPAPPLTGVSREISFRDEMFTGNESHYFEVSNRLTLHRGRAVHRQSRPP